MAVLYSTYQNVGQTDNVESDDWTNINNVIDSTSETYAEVTTPSFSESIYVYNNGIDSTSRVDYILKVEVGMTGYSPTNGIYGSIIGYNNDLNFDSDRINIFCDSTSNIEYWIDITNRGTCPGYGKWEWSDIDDLSIQYQSITYNYDGTTTVDFKLDNLKLKITTQYNPIKFYGLRCFDSNGDVTIDVTDSITRVLHSSFVDSTESGDIEVPYDPYSQTIGFAYTMEAEAMQHSITRTSVSPSTGIETWSYEPRSIDNGDLQWSAGRSQIIIMGY